MYFLSWNAENMYFKVAGKEQQLVFTERSILGAK